MNVQELTAETFKQKVMNYDIHPNEWIFEGSRPAIIDFYATWCGPCKQTAPIVEKLAEDYAGRIDVYKVDVDQQQELAAFFGVQSIPTILFIPKEGTPQRVSGAMPRSGFDEAIKQVFKMK
ncbi:MAG: thioredoxin [Prevotella sp.]